MQAQADHAPASIAGAAGEGAQLLDQVAVQGAQLVAVLQAEVEPGGGVAVDAFGQGAKVGEVVRSEAARQGWRRGRGGADGLAQVLVGQRISRMMLQKGGFDQRFLPINKDSYL